jgi:hypothetical protein
MYAQTRRRFLSALPLATASLAFPLHPTFAQSPTALAIAGALAGNHPAAYYRRAAEIFQKGNKDDAVFIFYLGQLRYRAHLQARTGELKPDGDPALFASLSEVVGRPLNEYAFGDIPALAKTLDAVLAYDRKNPDTFTPPARYGAVYERTRAGLASMRTQLLQQADSIRAERKKNGLQNRS